MGNDICQKLIHHRHECPIPIMAVNEGDDPVQTFMASNDDTFIDNVVFFNEGPPLPDLIQPNNLDNFEIPVDQQPTKRSSYLPKGITFCWHDNNKVKLCEMISNEIYNNVNVCKVKTLRSNDIINLPRSLVEPVCAPDPSSVPESFSDIDTDKLQETLSKEDLNKIWNNTDSTYSEDEKLFLYWHQRLRHVPQKYIRRLAKRGMIPHRLEHIKRTPMCTACKLSNASKRSWKGN